MPAATAARMRAGYSGPRAGREFHQMAGQFSIGGKLLNVIEFPPPLAGTLAGLLATVPQTLAMQAVRLAVPGPRGRFPPRQVTEAVVRRLLGRVRWSEPTWWAATAASHFAFGAAAGAAYPAIVRPGRLRGLLYGVAVGFVSYDMAMPAVGIHMPESDQPVRKNLQLIAAHVVWGLSMTLLFERLTTPPPGGGSRTAAGPSGI